MLVISECFAESECQKFEPNLNFAAVNKANCQTSANVISTLIIRGRIHKRDQAQVDPKIN